VNYFHRRPAPWYRLAKAHLIGHFLDRAVLADQLAYRPSQGKPGGIFLKPAAPVNAADGGGVDRRIEIRRKILERYSILYVFRVPGGPCRPIRAGLLAQVQSSCGLAQNFEHLLLNFGLCVRKMRFCKISANSFLLQSRRTINQPSQFSRILSSVNGKNAALLQTAVTPVVALLQPMSFSSSSSSHKQIQKPKQIIAASMR